VTCDNKWKFSSLRANGSRECAPDDRLREAIQSREGNLDCFVASLLAMTRSKLLDARRKDL